MPEPLSVNPQDMIRDGGAFTLIATTGNNLVTKAQSDIPEVNYWGDNKKDPVALTYGGNMVPNREGIFDTVRGFSAGMNLTGTQLTGNGVTFHNTDINNAE